MPRLPGYPWMADGGAAKTFERHSRLAVIASLSSVTVIFAKSGKRSAVSLAEILKRLTL